MIKYLLNTDDKQYTFLKVIQTKSTNNILFKIQTKNNRTINYIQETIKKLKKTKFKSNKNNKTTK